MNFISKKTFNNKEYDMSFSLKTGNVSISLPNKNSYYSSSKIIPTDSVVYFMIENSFTNPVPRAEFEIVDDQMLITNDIKSQNVKICVSIKYLSETKEEDLNFEFLIKNYSILEMSPDHIKYKIFAELDNVIPLNSICEYATKSNLYKDEERLENPYEIANTILNNANYKTFISDKMSENDKLLFSRYKLPYTNERCHFVTHQNMTVYDAIKYLLSYGIGETGSNGPAYLIHNLYNNKCYITSMEEIWKQSSIKQQPGVTTFPLSIKEATVNDRAFMMTGVDTFSENGGIDLAKLLFNYKFFEYNQETREWEHYNISKSTINDILTKNINNLTQNSLFLNLLNGEEEQFKNYSYSPHNHPVLYDILKQQELYSSNLFFTVDGDLQMDIGNVITVEEDGKNGEETEQFNGQWLITKVQHSFRNKEYKCHLLCSRRYYDKEK